MKTIEELQAELDSVLGKNSELLSEIKKLKNASREHNVDEYLKR